MLGAILQVPEGPLHPEDAVYALLFGLIVGLALRAGGRFAPALVPLAVVLAFDARHRDTAWDAVDGRRWSVLVCLAVVALAALPGSLSREVVAVRATLFTTAMPIAAVWAIVPDTEAAVIGGGVVAGAVVTAGGTWNARTVVPVWFVPAFAALVGSVGRPARLWPALIAVVVVAVAAEFGRRWRDQRAGTPTTVAPGATSDVTTAPAPTTAP